MQEDSLNLVYELDSILLDSNNNLEFYSKVLSCIKERLHAKGCVLYNNLGCINEGDNINTCDQVKIFIKGGYLLITEPDYYLLSFNMISYLKLYFNNVENIQREKKDIDPTSINAKNKKLILKKK